jgi:hypothetical protein
MATSVIAVLDDGNQPCDSSEDKTLDPTVKPWDDRAIVMIQRGPYAPYSSALAPDFTLYRAGTT